MKTEKPSFLSSIFLSKDSRWAVIWILAVTAVGIWNIMFLNKPALSRITTGFINTLIICLLVVVFTLILSWSTTLGLHFFHHRKIRSGYIVLTFILNLIRSVPQIVGVLLSYVIIAALITNGWIGGNSVFVLMAFCISVFIFMEMVDLMLERINHFTKLDFYNAMKVCGISEKRIVNFDILWKNSRIHIFNKLISVFGSAVFLQCSVDFIISVGLSTGVNTISMPVTLGSLLAKIDSKQDILAIGNTLFNPGYFPQLFMQHLQGLTVAFLIVFSLFSIYNISNGYAQRHRL
jgi:hypothetical protein